MIHLLHDGSVHDDWMSSHAIRAASLLGEKLLRVSHVLDEEKNSAEINRVFAEFTSRCARSGLKVEIIIRPRLKTVLGTLLNGENFANDDWLFCATRARGKRRGFLRGTISEQLLEKPPCRVFAVRVAQPGMAAHSESVCVAARDLFFPWDQPAQMSPLLHGFLQPKSSLHLLNISRMNSLRFRYLTQEKSLHLREQAHHAISAWSEELKREFPSLKTDYRTSITPDWVGDLLLHAERLKCELILTKYRPSLAEKTGMRNSWERLLQATGIDTILTAAPGKGNLS